MKKICDLFLGGDGDQQLGHHSVCAQPATEWGELSLPSLPYPQRWDSAHMETRCSPAEFSKKKTGWCISHC